MAKKPRSPSEEAALKHFHENIGQSLVDNLNRAVLAEEPLTGFMLNFEDRAQRLCKTLELAQQLAEPHVARNVSVRIESYPPPPRELWLRNGVTNAWEHYVVAQQGAPGDRPRPAGSGGA